jgi:hypothetical protein
METPQSKKKNYRRAKQMVDADEVVLRAIEAGKTNFSAIYRHTRLTKDEIYDALTHLSLTAKVIRIERYDDSERRTYSLLPPVPLCAQRRRGPLDEPALSFSELLTLMPRRVSIAAR